MVSYSWPLIGPWTPAGLLIGRCYLSLSALFIWPSCSAQPASDAALEMFADAEDNTVTNKRGKMMSRMKKERHCIHSICQSEEKLFILMNKN